jgi:hypothetical protein
MSAEVRREAGDGGFAANRDALCPSTLNSGLSTKIKDKEQLR